MRKNQIIALTALVIGLLFAGTVAVVYPSTSSNNGNTAAAASFPPCQVTLSTNSAVTQATATIVSGCVGPGFAFRSFVGIRTNVQFDEVTSAPWVVNLPTTPPCAWQIDFSFMPGTPQHKLYAFLTGSGPCPPPPTTTTTTTCPTCTTTTTTTTTVPPPSTTTTLPGCKSCQIPVPGPVTTTTLPPITREQQQIQISPGVTAGNG